MITETPDTLTTATAVPTATFPPGDLTAGTRAAKPDARASTGDMRERIKSIAGMAHQAIDKLEQRLGSASQGVMSTQSKGGEQVRQYGDKLRQRVSAQPLQTVGIALGTGVVLHKVFSRSPEPRVRVVRVPAPARSSWDTDYPERRASGWMNAARARMERLGDYGHATRDRVGAAAGLGLASTQQVTSTVARKATDLTHQARLAMDRLLSRTQDYGSVARSGIQSHPAAGVGAVVGLGALVTALVLQRRRSQPDAAYATVDDEGNRAAWRGEQASLQYRTRDMISERPVTTAVVVLGLGALIAAMVTRR